MSIESRSRQYGKVFDHWQIKEFLGSGSGGKTAVFRLVRSDSGWGVSALKVINLIEERGDINALSDYRKREYEYAREECSRNAEQEVRLMDDLRGNTNIVDYLDHTFVDWSDDSGFGRDLLIRMELLKDLRSEIRNGKIFSEREVLKIGRDICVALIRCHRKNILHRDVKPENIFRNKDGDYKLGDFGVSRVLDACPGAVASTGIGTYEYWPAEQMTGCYDKRVDIYSLGLVLYELCNQNKLPFASSTYATGREVSKRLSGEPVPPPSGASVFLTPVILKACAFDPNERYQTAEELLKALNSVIHRLRSKEAVDITPSPQKSNPKKDIYETIPVESERLPKKNTTNPYRTVATTRSGYRKQGSFETRPARSKVMYETEPVSKVYAERSESQASVNKNKFVLLAGMSVFVILLLVLGLLFVKSDKDEEILLKSEQKVQETVGNADATRDTAEGETLRTIVETEVPTEIPTDVPTEALSYTEVETEPIEMCTVYLQTSSTNLWNNIVYEYNEDGTLYRFANRSSPEYTTNYYIYDNGTLAEQIDFLNSDNSNQTDKSQVIENIRSLLDYPTEERIQYRIVVLEQGFPVREIFTDINLNITRDAVYSYDSNGNRTSIITNGYDPVVSESHTYIQYDSAGYQTYKESYYKQKDAEWNNLKNTYSYIRDADGKIIEEIKTDSNQGKTVVKYTYNSEQQLIRKDEYNEWGSATGQYYEYTYDEYGNVTQRKYKVSVNSEEAIDYNVYMALQVAADQLDALKLLYEYSMPSIPLNIQ